MPAETREQIRAALDRLEQVHLTDAATAAASLAVLVDGKEDGGDPVGAHQTAGDDALHALVPAGARDHERTLAVVDLLRLQAGYLGELRFDGATLVVDLLELGGLGAGRVEAVFEQQVEGDSRIPHAARRVQARNDAEGQRGGGNRLLVGFGLRQQGRYGRARRLVHASHAIRHQRAVIAFQRNQIRDRAECGQVGELAPEMRLPEAGAQRLHDLEGHPHAGEHAARIALLHLRIAHRHVLRHGFARLVVIGNEDLHAAMLQQHRFLAARDAAIHGDDHIRLECHEALDGRLGKAVTFVGAPRDEGHHVAAEHAQPAREDGSGADAVEVEVPEHEDAPTRTQCALQAVDHLLHARDIVGVAPVALEGGCQEHLRLGRGVDAAGDERGGDEAGQAQRALQEVDGSGICRLDAKTCGHGTTFNAYLFLVSYCRIFACARAA